MVLRLCFNRKNKTLGAAFKTKTVLEMLEKNYKTFCALKNVVVEPGLNIKDKVMAVLTESEFLEARPAKMDIDDFLQLLAAFNRAGIHFS